MCSEISSDSLLLVDRYSLPFAGNRCYSLPFVSIRRNYCLIEALHAAHLTIAKAETICNARFSSEWAATIAKIAKAICESSRWEEGAFGSQETLTQLDACRGPPGRPFC